MQDMAMWKEEKMISHYLLYSGTLVGYSLEETHWSRMELEWRRDRLVAGEHDEWDKMGPHGARTAAVVTGKSLS
jgi:hypothetical protein